MTRREVLLRAIDGRITWLQAADILGCTPRHMRRLRRGFEEKGVGVFRDGRVGNTRRKRISLAVVEKLLSLRRTTYSDFSVKHFHEKVTEKHGLKLSYTWTKQVLQSAGLAEKAPGRGKYRRKRERRPMVGMLMHLDASTHRWLPDLPMQDLVVALDDADGRILYAAFWEQEGTLSTMAALEHVLSHWGRFGELYTDRGSHFCVTTTADNDPDLEHVGQVQRALRTLGIRQILARSPEARGRSERAFGTIQGRLPQELRVARVRSYAEANTYLTKVFIPDFNRRFTVQPAQAESAFTRLVGVDLTMLLSAQHERTVRKDYTINFRGMTLQLEPSRHGVLPRCTVLVHQFMDGTLGVAFGGRILGRYSCDGELRHGRAPRKHKLSSGHV